MKQTLSLVKKYKDTKLYSQLFKKDLLDTKIIHYLAVEDKISRIDEIQNWNEIAIEDLQSLDKEARSDINLVDALQGGPHSDGGIATFFESKKEIRTIAKDGQTDTLTLLSGDDHQEGVKDIYKGKVNFPKDCTMGVERAQEAAKQIGSITFIIENTACFLYVPSDVSLAQKVVCKEWLDGANKDGTVGIFIYDREKDCQRIARDGEEFDIKEAVDYILNMNGRTTMEDLAKIGIRENLRISEIQEVEQNLPVISIDDHDWGLEDGEIEKDCEKDPKFSEEDWGEQEW